MPDGWKEELQLLLGITLPAAGAGVLWEGPLPGIAAGLFAYLAWHLYHLACLLGRLAGRQPRPACLPFGLWRVVFRDIDALRAKSRKRKSRLARLRNRFHDAVSALSEAVVILDRNARIGWINPAARQLLGIGDSGCTGQRFIDTVRDPILHEYLAGGDFARPLVFSPATSRARILSLYVVPIARQRQQMIVASDISRQYHLDAALRDFVANISHELRTPLTVLSGLLEQMQTAGGGSPADRRPLELMRNQTTRMSELISDLLTLCSLELNEQPPASDDIDVRELLTSLIEEARTLGRASAHQVELDIESAAGLRGERKELHTAISNLLTNAIRHTPQRTVVRVRWWSDATGAHLAVSDSGEGIAARHLPRLTERLYRVDASRSRATGGTGLGLAIVKHILERHGAELEITSTPGHGSTFTCHFPAGRLSV